MSAVPFRSRVIVSVRSRREAESTLAMLGVLCQATQRELVCRYAGQTQALEAWRLPIANMLDFAGERLDIGMEALASAMRRDSAACRDLVRSMAEALQIGWHFAGEGPAETQEERPGRGDIVVAQAPDGRPMPDELRKSLDNLPAGGGLLIPGQRRRAAHPAPMLLVRGDAPQPQTDRLAASLTGAGKGPLLKATLAELSASGPLRPAVVLVSESEARGASDAELAALLSLRATTLIVSEAT